MSVRRSAPQPRVEASSAFEARVVRALEVARGLDPAATDAFVDSPSPGSNPRRSSSTPIWASRVGPIQLRAGEAPSRPKQLWALLSSVERASPRELGISVGYGPRGPAPVTSLERLFVAESKRLDFGGPHRLPAKVSLDSRVRVHPDTLTSRAFLFQTLSRFVEPSGRFDERGFLAEFPDCGESVLRGLARACPSPTDTFGSTLDFHSLNALVECVDVLDPTLQAAILDGLPGIPESLPAVSYVQSQEKNKPLEGFVLFGVQHLLATQAPLFSAFEALGIERDDIYLMGVPYSTCPLMQRYFDQKKGYQVFSGDQNYPRGAFHDHRVEDIKQHLGAALSQAIATGKKVLVLDDGGITSEVVAKSYPELAHLFRFVEQTTRGITEAKRTQLGWPVVNVAESSGKKMEAVHIGRSVCRALMSELSGLGLREVAGARLTLAGYGTVGREMALILRDQGFAVTIVEKRDTDRGRANFEKAKADGFEVTTDLASVAARTSVLVGATGHRSITLDDVKRLPPGAIIASASSAEAEVPSEEIRDACEKSVPGALGKTTEYVLGRKSFVLLKDGRPINFDARLENVEPEAIQLTRGLMLLGALQAAKSEGAGLVPLDEKGPQVGLKQLVEKLWRGFKPLPIRSSSGPSEPVSMPSASADELQWQRYFASLEEVYPRTAEGRRWLDSAIFRAADGQLWFRRKDLDDVQLYPIHGDTRSGKLAHFEMVTFDVARVSLRGESGGSSLLVALGKEGSRVLRSTNASSVAAIRDRGDGISPISVEREGKSLVLIDDETGQIKSSTTLDSATRDEGRVLLLKDPPVYMGGDLSAGWRVLVTASEPPAFRLLDERLGRLTSTPIPKAIARIDHVESMGVGKGMTLAVGTGSDGRTYAMRMDLADGHAHEPVALPEGARFKQAIVNPPFRDAVVYFLPKGSPDEEHLLESVRVGL